MRGTLAFYLPSAKQTLCCKAKVAHVAFNILSEADCGMGFEFFELNESQRTMLNNHIVNEQQAYLELRELLAVQKPNLTEITKRLRQMQHLETLDLLSLRYRINRICTVFQKPRNPAEDDEKLTG